MSFEKLPVLEGGPSGCLCCGPMKSQLCRESIIAVGFGDAHLSRDGEIILSENDSEEFHTVAEAEALASADPDRDWRIVLHGPLRGSTYQRQGDMAWMLVEKNQGFA